MIASFIDGTNETVPIAFDITLVESKEHWIFIILRERKDIAILPLAKQSFCTRHLENNIIKHAFGTDLT
jgi:hypothetical protein